MTTALLAASYLSASLLTMLVPIATVVAVLSWLFVQVRRHERRREDVEAGRAPRSAASDGSVPVPGER
jgi:hypothetical protein